MIFSKSFDFNQIQAKKKKVKNLLLSDGRKRIEKRIAILGGSTTDEIKDMLELFLLDNGILPSFYQSEFNKYWEDVMFDNEELDTFKPDIIYIHTSNRNLSFKFNMGESVENISKTLENDFAHFEVMWRKIKEKYNCVIIQNNFDLCFYRMLGNKDSYDYHGFNNYIIRMNEKLNEYARSNSDFYICDLLYLQAQHGISRFSDPKYWYLYKYVVSVPYIPYLSFNVANIIKSLYGKNKKALILDLDNTLWGGVIGDDGVEGIEIGQETPSGQAYSEFQQYLKNYISMGVVLTVNSKNDEENALLGLNHPEGILKPEDFIIIKANWDPKALNNQKIAKELNLGEDALVFIDDNPAEREICHQNNPLIETPEINEVDEYIKTIDSCGFFEVTTFTDDDVKRNAMYKENKQREELQSSFDNYDDYLKSLNMRALIREFDDIYLQRITQLTNKSNQFNLTTKRFTDLETLEAKNDKDRICLYGKLMDKFGDNGVVTVVIGKKESEDVLGIELWLMSCRVLKRGIEEAMLDMLVKKAKEKGFKKLRGYYFKTAKNNMMRYLYKSFGFELVSEKENLDSIWELDISSYKNKNKFIEVIEHE